LPASLAQLAYRNGTTLRDDPHFGDDIERLIRALRQMKSPGAPMTDSAKAVIYSDDRGPRGPQPEGVVTAEAVFNTPVAQLVSSDNPQDAASSGLDWVAVARWALVAMVLAVCGAIGVGEGSERLAFAILLAAMPMALTIAAFPHLYQLIWIWTRKGTVAEYRRHHGQSEGWIVYCIVYGLVILIFFLLGLALAGPAWPPDLFAPHPQQPAPAGSHTESEQAGPSPASPDGNAESSPAMDTSPITGPKRFDNLFPPSPPKEADVAPTN
jgi:hypothetical protein